LAIPSAVFSRRKVISTRMPIETSSGRTSVSSTGRRPPPSKSHTANTTGGDCEYASESSVKVTTVAGTSAIGAGSMSSTLPPTNDTRAGGRCSAPVSRSREPTKPYFQSSRRSAAEADIRAGSGRLGGWNGNTPRHDRYFA
jgi:hypothetical protein